MKKLLLLLPLIIVACKEDKITTDSSSKDSLQITEDSMNTMVVDSVALRDS